MLKFNFKLANDLLFKLSIYLTRFSHFLEIQVLGAKEMGLRALAAFPDDPCLIPAPTWQLTGSLTPVPRDPAPVCELKCSSLDTRPYVFFNTCPLIQSLHLQEKSAWDLH